MLSKYMRVAAMAALGVVLTQCGPQPMDRATTTTSTTPGTPSDYPYDVRISFTPRAKAKITRLHEKVSVIAYYSGRPTPEGKAKADDMGQINLGIEAPVVDAVDQTVHMTGRQIDADLLPYVVDRHPAVLVNAATSRQAVSDNLLDCSLFEGDIRDAQVNPIAISCDLIRPDEP